MGRHRAPSQHSHRKHDRGVPAVVHETLLWACFAAVVALVVIILSGAPLWVAVGSAAGLLALAGLAYGFVRWANPVPTSRPPGPALARGPRV